MQVLRLALSPGGPLAPLTQFRRFIIYKLEWNAGKSKWDKRPANWQTGIIDNAHDESIQTDHATACAAAEGFGPGYGVGFVFTKVDGFFFLDIDNCLTETGWSGLAQALIAAFPGAAIEASVSGKGIHVFGRGSIPAHACKNEPLGLEFYCNGRFAALTGINAVGSAATDCSASIKWVVDNYFVPKKEGEFDTALWGVIPPPAEEDDALIKKMLASKPSIDAQLGGKAGIKDLWNANPGPLGKSYPDSGDRAYDASSADAGLFQHLAFWCKKNPNHMWRLALRPDCKLKRDKWNTIGPGSHKDYLQRTIERAITLQGDVYMDKADKKAADYQKAVDEKKATLKAVVPTDQIRPKSMDDFLYVAPEDQFLFERTGALWNKAAVDNTFGKGAADAITQMKPVHCLAWDPGKPMLVYNMTMKQGSDAWMPSQGYTTMNTYTPSEAVEGVAEEATPWIEMVKRLYPDYWEHIIDYFAFKVQYPGIKINHAMFFGGSQGIGKDCILAPVIYAVGKHNFKSVAPNELFGSFTPWTKHVLLRINEMRCHDANRIEMYEHLKSIVCAPPNTLTFNDKNVKAYSVVNVMGVVITSNDRDALSLPSDDRRYLILWTDVSPDETRAQAQATYRWYDEEHTCTGYHHVTAYLRKRDVSKFDPKAEPPKTPAFWTMVNAGISTGDAALIDAIEILGHPAVITLDSIRLHNGMPPELIEDMRDRQRVRQWPSRLAKIGYTAVRNEHDKAYGLFSVGGKRMTIYARSDLSDGARKDAANTFCKVNAIPRPPGL